MCLSGIIMTDLAPLPLIDFANASEERSESRPDPKALLAGDPQHVVRNFFADSTGQMFAGEWQSTSGRWRVRYTENEFCYITRGRVRIEGGGQSWTFSAGSAFVLPAGFIGVWEVIEPVTKLYVIFEGRNTAAR